MLIVLGLWTLYVSAAILTAVTSGEPLVTAVPSWVWGVPPLCYTALRGRNKPDDRDEP